jgi:hypothetical protein
MADQHPQPRMQQRKKQVRDNSVLFQRVSGTCVCFGQVTTAPFVAVEPFEPGGP